MPPEITKPTTVTFNTKIQKNVRALGTAYEFSEYVHMALREQIMRDRIRLGITDNDEE